MCVKFLLLNENVSDERCTYPRTRCLHTPTQPTVMNVCHIVKRLNITELSRFPRFLVVQFQTYNLKNKNEIKLLKRAPNCPCRNERSVRRRWWWWWKKTAWRKHRSRSSDSVLQNGFQLDYRSLTLIQLTIHILDSYLRRSRCCVSRGALAIGHEQGIILYC